MLYGYLRGEHRKGGGSLCKPQSLEQGFYRQECYHPCRV